MDEKLQKVLAQVGIGSRREMERWIEAGRVQVNGKLATLGDRVTAEDKIKVDGRLISSRFQDGPRQRVILYNKPEGEICSRSDPDNRTTVFDTLPRLKGERWVAVGRLDFNTSGLLLFTTDGSLANALMHPSTTIEREYAVRIRGRIDNDMLARLREGVMLEDGVAKFSDIQMGRGEEAASNQWYYVVLTEGRNREVRRLFESQGVTVSRLKRVRFGTVLIPSKVKAGQWIELNEKEVEKIVRMSGLPITTPTGAKPKEKEAVERQSRKVQPRRSSREGGSREGSSNHSSAKATKQPFKTKTLTKSIKPRAKPRTKPAIKSETKT